MTDAARIDRTDNPGNAARIAELESEIERRRKHHKGGIRGLQKEIRSLRGAAPRAAAKRTAGVTAGDALRLGGVGRSGALDAPGDQGRSAPETGGASAGGNGSGGTTAGTETPAAHEAQVEPGEAFEIVQPAATASDAEPPKRKYAKSSAKDTEASADLLVTIIESLAIATVGPEAAMQEGRRQLIRPSLARTLARLDSRATQAIQNLSDPIAVIAGFGMYAMDVAEARRIQSLRAQVIAPDAQGRMRPEQASEPTAAPPTQNDTSVAPPPPEIVAASLAE